MLKLYLTLVLLGAFLGQSQGAVGDKCYKCTYDSTGAGDTVKCLTPESGTTPTEAVTAAAPYCYTSVDGTTTTRGITSLNVCEKDEPLAPAGLTLSTCSGALCNDDDTTTGDSLTVEACEECKQPTACPGTTDCSACPAGNSGTKATRGFGVIMTSVSLSYVITKFL